MRRLEYDFYNRHDVVAIARELLGKILVSYVDGVKTSGRIVETEAYAGITDKASHAYNGRRTNRTEVMFGEPGKAYVYLCYGIHHLFNIVTNVKGIPHAVLIRALEPIEGVQHMLARTKKSKADHTLTRGPGNVTRALGLDRTHTGVNLLSEELYVMDDDFVIAPEDVVVSPRIGVDYAAEDALLLYRFNVRGNPYVTKTKKSL
ncbi:MAG: DNA-3-methyladenine glycosylase [Chitinophagaceae bacterium]|nr:MAG: DNA-3-methyladenine glycosylase [Chitinophagaceae bacterium]